MVDVAIVKPKPGQSMEEALRTAPVHQIDQAMWARCPKAIIDLVPPGQPGAHYDAQGNCDCAREKKLKDALRHATKVGWTTAADGKWSHLIVRPEDRSAERTTCGLDIELLRPERSPKPVGGCCSKCRAYAVKRRWL